MGERPCCPSCAATVDAMRPSCGVVAVYPCRCWLTPGQARQVAAAARTTACGERREVVTAAVRDA